MWRITGHGLKNRSKNEVTLDKTPGWKRTNNVIGHEPTFKIHCKMCDKHFGMEVPMALRHSTIAQAKTKDGMERSSSNQVCYKCPVCGWFITFEVRDSQEYLNKVYKEYRGGKIRFIPDADDWSKESKEIGEQLKALGYWGGRGD